MGGFPPLQKVIYVFSIFHAFDLDVATCTIFAGCLPFPPTPFHSQHSQHFHKSAQIVLQTLQGFYTAISIIKTFHAENFDSVISLNSLHSEPDL